MGRLGSYAGLLYTANTPIPTRAKFYGDIQEKITAISSDLMFFELELNRIEERDWQRRCRCRRSRATSRGSTTCARRSPTSSMRQLEQLFHEKGDDRARRFEPALQRDNDRRCASRSQARPRRCRSSRRSISLSDPDGGDAQGRRRGARQGVQGQHPPLHARSPTRSPRTRRSPTAGVASRMWPTAAISPTASRRQSSRRWSPRCARAYPRLSHRYYALKARWLGMDRLAYWDRNAPLPDKPERVIPWADARRAWC